MGGAANPTIVALRDFGGGGGGADVLGRFGGGGGTDVLARFGGGGGTVEGPLGAGTPSNVDLIDGGGGGTEGDGFDSRIAGIPGVVWP